MLNGTQAHRFNDFDAEIGSINTQVAGDLIAAATDVAIVLNAEGVVLDMALADPELVKSVGAGWIGNHWKDTASPDSEHKIDALIAEASSKGISRQREVNHRNESANTLPIRYTVVRVGNADRLIAFGRDLRALSEIQQRLVTSQMSMEREYSRARQAETCYRLLFQLSSEAVLISDASSQSIADANPAIAKLLGVQAGKLVGRRTLQMFAASDRDAIKTLLAAASSVGTAESAVVHLVDSNTKVTAAISLFRQGDAEFHVIRLTPADAVARNANSNQSDMMAAVMERMPEGFVVIDDEHIIQMANAAFLNMTQTASQSQVRGRRLGDWLTRPNVDLNLLLTSLRENGSVTRFPTTLRGEHGSTEHVHVTGVLIPGDKPLYGLIFGSMTERQLPATPETGVGGRTVEQITSLIGHMSLKEVVRESADVIERLCIESALKLTRDNKASAAQVLGVSRQSLYSKMRRHGVGDVDITRGKS